MRKVKPGIVRTTFDFSADAAHLADTITTEANLPSRKEAVERSIRFYGQVLEALKQGLRLILVNGEGKRIEMSLDVPVVIPRPAERQIVARIHAREVARLVVVANQPHHPAATVVLRIAMAASHPHGPQPLPASLLAQLIYWALRLEDDEFLGFEFLGLTREVVTTCVTACDSFAHLLSLEAMPAFDTNHLEQQFLWDELLLQKRKELSS